MNNTLKSIFQVNTKVKVVSIKVYSNEDIIEFVPEQMIVSTVKNKPKHIVPFIL